MSSPYRDLDRPGLNGRQLTTALRRSSQLWREVVVVRRTGSTNDDVVALARAGDPEGIVLVAEEQTAGRGRHDRGWQAPPGAALTFSMLLRPPVPPACWLHLPLLAGLAVTDAVGERYEIDARLKWPNDVHVDGRKLAGVLSEVAGDAVVVGVGLNVLQSDAELPDAAAAVSLAGVAEEPVDRSITLLAVLRAFERRYGEWLEADGSPDVLLPAYRHRCETLGRAVRVELADGALDGTAVEVDERGRLVVETADGERRHVAAGDVVHLRRT